MEKKGSKTASKRTERNKRRSTVQTLRKCEEEGTDFKS